MKMTSWASLLLLLTACTSTDFLRYEGRKDLVFEGQGGARTVVDGVDFWEQGEPPRKYQLLGYIRDERGTGLIYRLKKNGDIAAKAKAVGGDAVMALSSSTTLTGTIVNNVGGSATTYGTRSATTTGYGTTVSVPVGRTEGSYAVLKYLD